MSHIMKSIKKLSKKKKSPAKKVNLNIFDIEDIVERARELKEEFVKKGFTDDQAFELTSIVLKKYLG